MNTEQTNENILNVVFIKHEKKNVMPFPKKVKIQHLKIVPHSNVWILSRQS